MQRNGKILLQDVINKTTVCFLIPPTTHLITTPCSPVYALNTRQKTLFIKGKPKSFFAWQSFVSFRRKVLLRESLETTMDMWAQKLHKQCYTKLNCCTVTKGFNVLCRWPRPQLQCIFWRRKSESAFHLRFWRVWHHEAAYCFTCRLSTTTKSTELCHSGGNLQSLPSAKVAFFVSLVHYNHNVWYPVEILLPRWIRWYVDSHLKDKAHETIPIWMLECHVFPVFSCEERCRWMKGTKLWRRHGTSYRKLQWRYNRDTADLQPAKELQLCLFEKIYTLSEQELLENVWINLRHLKKTFWRQHFSK